MRKPKLHLVELKKVSIYQQLQWEEAVLRANCDNWCILNQGSLPAIVMGISGKRELLINEKKWQQAPIPIIRRFTGGGTVVVDENTIFVTFIFQSDAFPMAPFPRAIMEWSAGIYRPLFAANEFQMNENDYTILNKKWGGNAQSITKGRWLHHTSILWNYHEDRMEYLLEPPKMPLYREKRSHSDFLCRLSDHWNHNENFQDKLKDVINDHFNIENKTKDDLVEIAKIPHRQMTCMLGAINIKNC